MKRTLLLLAAALLLAVPSVRADNVGVDIHLRLGDPAPAPLVIAQPPVFLFPPTLGFFVAVGVPYDLFFIGDRYYSHRGGVWYVAPHYGGPWYFAKPDHLPPGLVKHKYPKIIELRDAEYRNYQKDRDHYPGKRFEPGKQHSEDKGGHDSGDGHGKGGGHGDGHGKGKGKGK